MFNTALLFLTAGLWLFSRKPVDPANTAVMREKAQQLGFDLSVLKKVQQEGCDYTAPVAAAAGGSRNGGSGTLPLFKRISISLG
jgi:hypothetical protein